MHRNQWLVVLGGIVVVIALYAFGKRVAQAEIATADQAIASNNTSASSYALSSDEVIEMAKKKLPEDLQLRILGLEKSVTRGGEVKEQKIQVNQNLAKIWDSIGNVSIAAYYNGENARLRNAQRGLTKAANTLLTEQKKTEDEGVKGWQAKEARSLLDKAIALNPNDDTVKIALAKSDIAMGDVMKGVESLMAITERLPKNIEANMALGQLSLNSGQFLKAIERLNVVVDQQPNNVEALYYLAESYKNTGKKKEAIQLFEKCKQLINDPGFTREIDDYIRSFN